MKQRPSKRTGEAVESTEVFRCGANDHARYRHARDAQAAAEALLDVLEDAIPAGDETDRLHRWGYRRHREMFNDRQLLGLALLLKRITAVPTTAIRHALITVFSDTLRYQALSVVSATRDRSSSMDTGAGSRKAAKSQRTQAFLPLRLCAFARDLVPVAENTDKARYQNMLCRYDTYALKCQDIFSVHGFAVGLVQCENNVLGIARVGSGSFRHFVEKFARAKSYCVAPFETRHAHGKKEHVSMAGETIKAECVTQGGAAAVRKTAWLSCSGPSDVPLAQLTGRNLRICPRENFRILLACG